MILIPINGKGSINNNNLGKSLPLLVSCLLAKLCAILTGGGGSIFKYVPRLCQHHHCCSFIPTISFLNHSFVSQLRVPPLLSPCLSSSFTLLLTWSSGKHSTIHKQCPTNTLLSRLRLPCLTLYNSIPHNSQHLTPSFMIFCCIFVSSSQCFS